MRCYKGFEEVFDIFAKEYGQSTDIKHTTIAV
jgi:hypothetical protein